MCVCVWINDWPDGSEQFSSILDSLLLYLTTTIIFYFTHEDHAKFVSYRKYYIIYV